MPSPHVSALVLTPLIVSLLATAPARAAAPTIVTATFLGGDQDDDVRGVAIAADGAPILALKVTRAGGTELVEGAVVRLAPDGKAVVWRQALPEAPQDVVVDAAGAIFALGTRHVFRIDPGSGAIAAMSAPMPNLAELSAGMGEVSVIAGQSIHRLGGAMLDAQATVEIRGKNLSGLQTDSAGGFYVSGDTVSSTGCEPYRIPYVHHYDRAGKRDWSYLDYPGPLVRANKQNLQADTQIRMLRSDPRGRLWFVAQSDGTNTVLTRKHWHLEEENPFIWQGCYPSACRWYSGAKLIRMVGRLTEGFDELGAGTWWVPYARRPSTSGSRPPEFFEMWEARYGACGCRDDRYWRPMSSWLSGVAFSGDDAILVGGADSVDGAEPVRPPVTSDAWYGAPAGANYYVAVIDQDLRTPRFAAALPGVKSISVAARAGRMVLAGAAADAKGGAFMVKDAAQPKFGGGAKDGFVLIACLPGAVCDGTLPAVNALARPAPRMTSIEWPKFSGCMGGNGTTITAGGLPPAASYAGAPTTPPPSGRIDEPGAPGGPVAPTGGTSRDAGVMGTRAPDAGSASAPASDAATGAGAPSAPIAPAVAAPSGPGARGAAGTGDASGVAPEAAPDAAASDPAGCSCSTAGRSPRSSAWPLLLGVAIVAARLRRRG
jgi:MYXO-CTERM domain-containing protein